jgi:hypothetical protein
VLAHATRKTFRSATLGKSRPTDLVRSEAGLELIDPDNWTSPRLGIRFDLSGEELQIYRPDGQPFVTYTAMAK